MKTVKRILNGLVDALVILIFVIACCLVVGSISKKKTGVASVFGYTFNIVVTDSMEPTINVDDVIISKVINDKTEIKVNEDIISFYDKVSVGGKEQRIVIAHRVVDIKEVDGVTYYVTRGDNYEVCPENDPHNKLRGDIESVYCFRIKGLGKTINFLREPLGFILCIVAPIVIFIAFLVYRLIKMYVSCKNEEMIEKQKEETSDDVKDAIIKEYLARQQKEQSKEENDKKEQDE